MAENEPRPFSNHRLSLIFIVVGMIALEGYPIISMAQTPQTGHAWQEVASLATFAAGGTNLVFNSTCGGATGKSAGVGLNFTLPNPTWNLPLTVPMAGPLGPLTSISIFIDGWVTLSIGSPNSTSIVIVGAAVVASTVGIPAICQPIPATDDNLRFGFVSRFGPANPAHRTVPAGTPCAGTECAQRDTIPFNGYVETGCHSVSSCYNPNIRVFIYIGVACSNVFTGPGLAQANSCALPGKGSNGFDLGNATITAGKLTVFA